MDQSEKFTPACPEGDTIPKAKKKKVPPGRCPFPFEGVGRGEPIDRRFNNSGMCLGAGFNSQWADGQQAGGRAGAGVRGVFLPSHCLFPGCGEGEAGGQLSGLGAH